MPKYLLTSIIGILVFLSCCKKKEEPYIPTDTSLPVIKINTFNSESIHSKDSYIDAEIEVTGVSSTEDISTSILIRGRGNSTWTFPKKPYKIKFEEKTPLLDMLPDKKWVFLANYTDKTMLRNKLGLHLGSISNLDWTPDSRFIELYINEEYVGTYLVTQQVEQTSNRVDISKEGYLLEVDVKTNLDDDDVYFETDDLLFNIKEPELIKGDADYNYISEFMHQTEDALFGVDFKDPGNGYSKYIDIPSIIDWYLINEITKNHDANFYTSVYMNLIKGGKLKLGPIWDFDLSCGNINYGGSETPIDFYMKNGDWMSRLFEDEQFVIKVKERFKFFYNNKDEIYSEIDLMAEYIDESQINNYEKWGTLGTYVWPNFVYFDTYDEEVEYLKSWLDKRFEWLNNAYEEL